MARRVLYTATDLESISARSADRYELVRGRLVKEPPAGYRHGRIASRLLILVGAYAEEHGLGDTLASETGFILSQDPDTVRAPDVAFVRRERLLDQEEVGYSLLVPDLIAEVVSPGNTASEVQAKVEDWLEAGTRLVWVVYPETRSVVAYRSLSDVRVLRAEDTLEGDDVLPGFTCRVRDIF